MDLDKEELKSTKQINSKEKMELNEAKEHLQKMINFCKNNQCDNCCINSEELEAIEVILKNLEDRL